MTVERDSPGSTSNERNILDYKIVFKIFTYRLLDADLHWLPLSFNEQIMLDTGRSLTLSANPFFASYSRKVLDSESLRIFLFLSIPPLPNSFYLLP